MPNFSQGFLVETTTRLDAQFPGTFHFMHRKFRYEMDREWTRRDLDSAPAAGNWNLITRADVATPRAANRSCARGTRAQARKCGASTSDNRLLWPWPKTPPERI